MLEHTDNMESLNNVSKFNSPKFHQNEGNINWLLHHRLNIIDDEFQTNN